jgi:hypothetical protein
MAALRPTTGLERWPPLDSVSAYYYTGAVGVFVGILFALALFLFTYGGYKKYLSDRIVGKIGGACALGVALFPTAAPPGLSEPSWWSETTMMVHYVSAASLFGVFIVFALWLFRKTEVPKGEELGKGKVLRNRIYLVCGVVMVVCVLWAGSSYWTQAPIFLPEIIALIAFAVSWLVKGYAHRPVVNTVKRVRPILRQPSSAGPRCEPGPHPEPP